MKRMVLPLVGLLCCSLMCVCNGMDGAKPTDSISQKEIRAHLVRIQAMAASAIYMLDNGHVADAKSRVERIASSLSYISSEDPTFVSSAHIDRCDLGAN